MSNSLPPIDFASVLASSVHDMKNSLCMLLQSIELMHNELEQKAPDTQQELAKIHYEANRLNTNLLQLLSLYRLERNQLPLQIDDYYLIDILEEIQLKNELYIEQKQIQLQIQCDADLHWFFDRDLITNLVNDIVVNAIRYTQQQLTICTFVRDGWLCIEVHDDGAGFPEAMLTNSDLLMGKTELSRGHTGLGLFFAHLIAHAHQHQGRRGQIALSNGGIFGGGLFQLQLP
ncbi:MULTISPECIES: sensor histidine kinase [Alkalimonas]|uniref:HAMP domain-containing sensor histidine kinase n=1 Tax=Alkalimonas mucilaginosa TaxID=3057676 RepID=A0ABU7JIU5_9GAMM|nr:HAMP domain-containing sensor histidine kinase [Alkalimonas sp. MEB004]MEE2025619.1 HAMP domain-containing sensor histidine kinase [Alkalimonas sp. MEB004]